MKLLLMLRFVVIIKEATDNLSANDVSTNNFMNLVMHDGRILSPISERMSVDDVIYDTEDFHKNDPVWNSIDG